MNQFFELLGGPIAVLLSIIATIFTSNRWKRDRKAASRRFLVGILYWGPIFLMACMGLHLFQNAYRSLVSFQETGAFNFYDYSLQLFGFVVGYQAFLLLKKCRDYAAAKPGAVRRLLFGTGLIVFTTLPTSAFTPIGFIPTAVLLLMLLASAFVRRRARKSVSIFEQLELSDRLSAEKVLP